MFIGDYISELMHTLVVIIKEKIILKNKLIPVGVITVIIITLIIIAFR